MATRVLLAIGHRLYREALRDAMVQILGVEIIAETDNGREAFDQVCELGPDLAILELALNQLNGAEGIRQMRRERPHLTPVVVLLKSDYLVVMRVLQAGARACVGPDAGLEELQHAVRTALDGRIFLNAEMERTVVESLSDPSQSALTPREMEVLQLIVEGKPTRGVAETLSVSSKTVETHRQHIMEKLGLYSVAQLTKYAIREGITTLALGLVLSAIYVP